MSVEPGDRSVWGRRADGVRTWLPLVISLCAISLTIFQATAARKHMRLGVAPKLDWRITSEADDAALSVSLINVGFGPAAITHVTLHHDGAEVGPADGSSCDRLDALLGRDGPTWETACFSFKGEYFLRPGESILLYASRRAPGATEDPSAGEAVDVDKFWISARYCSFYEECWEMGVE